jgi:transposase-like protein
MNNKNKTKIEKNTSVPANGGAKTLRRIGFKREAVEHWLRSGKSGSQIAKEMGISYPSPKEWKRRYGGDAALCAAPGVSRSCYYRWKDAEPGSRAREDAELSVENRSVHEDHRGVYGSPRVMRALRARGRRHGRKRIARLMRAERLRGKCPRRFVPCTTQSAGTPSPSPRTGWPRRPTHRAQPGLGERHHLTGC